MADELKIPVSVTGGPAAQEQLKGVAEAEKQVGQAADDSSRKAESGYDRARRRLAELEEQIASSRYEMNRSGESTDAQQTRLVRLEQAADGYRKRLAEVDSQTATYRAGLAQTAEQTDKTEGVTGKLAAGVMRLISAYAGMRGVMWIMSTLRQESEKTLEVTTKVIEALRASMAMAAVQGERKEVRESIFKMAVEGGRKVEEVAPAYYTLMGGTFGMDRSKQQGLMREALAMGKTDPKASLDALVNLFTTIASQQPQLTPEQIGNLASQTVEQAKGTVEEVAAYLPDVLSAAQAGKVAAEEAAAMFSFATRKGGGVAKSGQAVKSMMLGLLAPTDETLKEMKKLGFPAEAPLTDRLAWLGTAAEKMPPELQAALGGRRGIQAVAAVAGAPEEFAAETAGIRRATFEPGSRVQERLAGMYGEDAAQRMLEQSRQVEVLMQAAQYDVERVRKQNVIEFLDLIEKRRGTNTAWRYALKGVSIAREAVGLEPMAGVGGTPALRGMLDLLKEGWTPQDLMDIAYPAFEKEMQGPTKTPVTAWDEQPLTDEFKARMRSMMRSLGRRPMGEGGPTYQGGTHYHLNEKKDPATRPIPPAGQ